MSSSGPYLDWRDRPSDVTQKIDTVFKYLENQTASTWYFNGIDDYTILGIRSDNFLKFLIEQSKDKKEFYILDIGAGNFQFGQYLSKAIVDTIPKDIKIHIIGIRGEKNLEKEIHEDGPIIRYEFGGFKIENLIEEFNKKGLDLVKKLDFITSRWCFRHLVDPLGTFLQAYSLLRPESGYLLMDGFLFGYENIELSIHNPLSAMFSLLLNTHAPFIWKPYIDRTAGHFLLRRPNAEECLLHLHYKNVFIGSAESFNLPQKAGIFSDSVTFFDNTNHNVFRKQYEKGDVLVELHDETSFLWGDKFLCASLKENNLLEDCHYNSNSRYDDFGASNTEEQEITHTLQCNLTYQYSSSSTSKYVPTTVSERKSKKRSRV